MSYKDPERKRQYDQFYNKEGKRRRAVRIYRRNKRHPGWRQTYLDYNGMCAKCGETEKLEFHEPFGELKPGEDPRFQVRMLLCNACHSDEHAKWGIIAFPDRACSSHLEEDVAWEIQKAGGLDNWIKKFGLEPSKNYAPMGV